MKNTRATVISAFTSLGIMAGGWTLGSMAAAPDAKNERVGALGLGTRNDADDSQLPPPAEGDAGSSASPSTSSSPRASSTASPGATNTPKKSASTSPADATKESKAPEARKAEANDTKAAAPAPQQPARTYAPAVQAPAPQAPAPQAPAPRPPVQQPAPQPVNNSRFRAGSYSATSGHRFGDITVTATFSGDRITDVYSNSTADDSRSQGIEDYTIPILRQRVLRAQSANIEGITGATLTSGAYRRAMQQVIDQASR